MMLRRLRILQATIIGTSLRIKILVSHLLIFLPGRCRASSPTPCSRYCIPHRRCSYLGAKSPPWTNAIEPIVAHDRVRRKQKQKFMQKFTVLSDYFCSVLSLLIPSAFFSAIDRGENTPNLLTDETRHQFLQMSRGLAVILLCMCVFPHQPLFTMHPSCSPIHPIQLHRIPFLPSQPTW